jgi:hypothetical protein
MDAHNRGTGMMGHRDLKLNCSPPRHRYKSLLWDLKKFANRLSRRTAKAEIYRIEYYDLSADILDDEEEYLYSISN